MRARTKRRRAIDPDVANAAGHGGKPRPRPSMRVTSFRPFIKGALRGHCNIAWDSAGLLLIDCPIFVSAAGKAWCGLPAAPIIDSAGRHYVVNGKKQYRPLLEWRDRDRSAAFSARVIELLLKRFPDALDDPNEREQPASAAQAQAGLPL